MVNKEFNLGRMNWFGRKVEWKGNVKILKDMTHMERINYIRMWSEGLL